MTTQDIIVIETKDLLENYSVEEIRAIMTRNFQSAEGKTVIGSIDKSKSVIAIEISSNVAKAMDKIQNRKKNPISYTDQVITMITEDFHEC